MAKVTKPKTFSAGTVAVSGDVNTNFDTIYNEFNGSIDNDNIKTSAGIVDTKLAQITSTAKVSGTALTGLTSIPAQNVTLTGEVTVTDNSVLADSHHALYISSSAAQTSSSLVYLYSTDTSSSYAQMTLNNNGKACAIDIIQNGLVSDGKAGLTVASYGSQTSGNTAYFLMVSTASTVPCVNISNSGKGAALYINQYSFPAGDTACAITLYGCCTANGTSACTLSALAPAGVSTPTVAKWLLLNADGTTYYIPMWT